ncbi:MAG: dTMP kinase [Patescibacteria group bacterium]
MTERKALFICFEGLDGSGKTTQAKLLAASIDGFYTREPSDFPIGKLIRQRLQGQSMNITQTTFQIMYAADRGDHFAGEIIPNLENNKHVVIDRYFFSSLALGSSQGIDFDWLNEINKHYPIPDVHFYIDTPIDECLQRIKEKSPHYQVEFFEKKETLIKAAQAYQKMILEYTQICSIHPNYSPDKKLYVIDGTKSVDFINQQLLDIIKNYQQN